MTSLWIVTLAAFALLALIIVVLIKTTRLRAWQGVVLFLLPLLLAEATAAACCPAPGGD